MLLKLVLFRNLIVNYNEKNSMTTPVFFYRDGICVENAFF